MKKIITLALSVVAMLTSCSTEEIGSSVNPDQVTITLAAEDAVATRAASTAPTRYIAEAYSDDAYTTPIAISGSDSQIESTDGTFQVTIDRTQDYYFLFWSDVSGNDVYTTDALTAVTLNSDKTPVESWQGTAEILNGTSQPTLSVTLSRAVAKINLMETGALLANSSLAMTFAQNTVFDVSSGSVSTTATRTETIANESAISGSTTAVQLNSSEIYLFAAVNTETVHDITFKMNDEESFKITNVPFQANHATNISGHYTSLASETFTLSVDDTWATPDNDMELVYAVGDFYPNEDSAIGVVFEISNGGANGKIISLDEAFKQWSTGYMSEYEETWHYETSATDADNGRNNMATILSAASGNYTYSDELFPAVAWAHAKNIKASAETYTADATGVWYLPAKTELTAIKGVITTLNDKLDTDLSADYVTGYWSSTENNTGLASFWYFADYASSNTSKAYEKYVRAVLAF